MRTYNPDPNEMTRPKKRSSLVHQEVVPELCPEVTKEPNIDAPVFIGKPDCNCDVGCDDCDQDPIDYDEVDVGEAKSEAVAATDKQEVSHFAHDVALEIQRIRRSGIKTRVQLLNFILNTSEYLISQSDSDPKYNARKAELIEASRELKSGYRRLQDFIKPQEQELFESLHSVLAGAFLIGLASDATGLSVSDAKKLAGSIFAANARQYAQKAAEDRAEKFADIVRAAIPIAFQRHEILKKLSNSDQSADILMPIVKELAAEYVKEETDKGNKGEVGTNTIRQAIKRITGGKRGGIRKDSPEFRELLEQATPV